MNILLPMNEAQAIIRMICLICPQRGNGGLTVGAQVVWCPPQLCKVFGQNVTAGTTTVYTVTYARLVRQQRFADLKVIIWQLI